MVDAISALMNEERFEERYEACQLCALGSDRNGLRHGRWRVWLEDFHSARRMFRQASHSGDKAWIGWLLFSDRFSAARPGRATVRPAG
jgi:hypothetical protein